MKRFAFIFLFFFVATIPLQELFFDQLHGYVGSVPRLAGIAAFLLGVVAATLGGKFGVPGRVHYLMIFFVAWSMLSVVWSIAPDLTWERNLTFVQTIAMVWLLLQFAQSKEEMEWMLIAYMIGCFVVVSVVLYNAITGQALGGLTAYKIKYIRFQAFRSDPNELALGVAMAIPMAWYFFSKSQNIWRVIALAFIPLAVLGILLTGSRGGALAAAGALFIVPFTYFRLKRTAKTMVLVATLAGIALLPAVLPESTWQRVATLANIFESQTRYAQVRWTDHDVRVRIWAEGLAAFSESPIFGIGSSAYARGTASVDGEHRVAHSVWVSPLAELGLIGFGLWVGLVGLCLIALRRFPSDEATLWFFVFLAWGIGASFLSWEHTKNTWLLLGLVAARDANITFTLRRMAIRARQSQVFQRFAPSRGIPTAQSAT